MSTKLIDSLKIKIPELFEAEIEGLLHILSKEPTLSNEKLTIITGLPLETLKVFRKLLEGLTFQSVYKPYEWRLITFTNPDVEAKLNLVRTKYDLHPKRDLDQFFATPQSSVSKAEILIKKGFGSLGKNILLLGDDDLVSLTLALLGAKSNIYVCDVDNDILESIEKAAKEFGITNIKTFVYDARNTPKLNTNLFDCVVTDPPYTIPGIDLFLSRALQFLKNPNKNSGGTIALFYGNSFKSPEKFIKIQQVINKYNMVIEDKINKFVSYTNADSIGNSSSLYLLRTTPFSDAFDSAASNNIYTFEATKDEKFPFVDHVVFRINRVLPQILKSKQKLLTLLGTFCNEHKFKVVDTKVTNFSKDGMTITFVLSNSSLVVHTWPEFEAIHIDLITCSPIFKKELLVSNLSKLFGSGYISYSIIA